MKMTIIFIMILFAVLSCACENENSFEKKTKKPVTIRYINNPSDSEVVIYTTGMPDAEYREASLIIAKKYGFTFWPAAGCVVSDSIIESVKKRNEITYIIIANNNGADWKPRYKKEVDILQNRVSKAKKIFYNSPLHSYLNRQDNHSGTVFDFTPNDLDTNFVSVKVNFNKCWKNYILTEHIGTLTIDLKKME